MSGVTCVPLESVCGVKIESAVVAMGTFVSGASD